MENCLFCDIAANKIPSKKVYESDTVIAFNDINPKAPVHILIIPKEHIASVQQAGPHQCELLGNLILAAKQIASDLNIAEAGYRLVLNCGKNAGQEVFHIHLHLLGGRQMNWPPG